MRCVTSFPSILELGVRAKAPGLAGLGMGSWGLGFCPKKSILERL